MKHSVLKKGTTYTAVAFEDGVPIGHIVFTTDRSGSIVGAHGGVDRLEEQAATQEIFEIAEKTMGYVLSKPDLKKLIKEAIDRGDYEDEEEDDSYPPTVVSDIPF